MKLKIVKNERTCPKRGKCLVTSRILNARARNISKQIKAGNASETNRQCILLAEMMATRCPSVKAFLDESEIMYGNAAGPLIKMSAGLLIFTIEQQTGFFPPDSQETAKRTGCPFLPLCSGKRRI